MKERLFQLIPKADMLLNHVIQANWKKVEKIICTHPDLMLQIAKAIDINGYEIEISPLDYALRVNDMFTLTIFQKHVTAEHKDKFYDLINQQPDAVFSESETTNSAKQEYLNLVSKWQQNDPTVTLDVLRDFLRKQASLSPQSCFNLQPFYWAYESFLALPKAPKTFEEFWVKIVGWAQGNLLPRHMLKQICAGSIYNYNNPREESDYEKFKGLLTWSPSADFSYLDYHIPLHLSDHTDLRDRTIGTIDDIFTPSPRHLTIGEDFALARDSEYSRMGHYTHAWNKIICAGCRAAKHDLATFRHLADVRHQQVKEMGPGIVSRLWNYFLKME